MPAIDQAQRCPGRGPIGGGPPGNGGCIPGGPIGGGAIPSGPLGPAIGPPIPPGPPGPAIGPPGPPGCGKPKCDAPGGPNPGGGGGGGPKPKAMITAAAPAVKAAPKKPPTSPAPSTTRVEWRRFSATTGASCRFGCGHDSWLLGSWRGVVGGHATPHVVGLLVTATVGAELEVDLKKSARAGRQRRRHGRRWAATAARRWTPGAAVVVSRTNRAATSRVAAAAV